MSPGTRDRGAADALGLVLIAPVAVGLAVLVVLLGRDVDARAQVRSAAAAGAQAAALERDPDAAARAAREIVEAMLVDDDACATPEVTVDAAVDQPATRSLRSAAASGAVRVTVRCNVSERGLELLRTGSRRDEFTATATVDVFRVGGTP